MDVDMMTSNMMMQMQKLPNLCEPYYTLNSPPPPPAPEFDFSTAFHGDPLMNPPPPISFPGTPPLPPLAFQETNASASSVAAMREIIFRIAAMQPIHIDPKLVKPPKRRNVRISKDPQSVAARHRRERISERIRILQRLVPGGTKMDTASMLDEAIHYVKFLKRQVQSLEQVDQHKPPPPPFLPGVGRLPPAVNGSYSSMGACRPMLS